MLSTSIAPSASVSQAVTSQDAEKLDIIKALNIPAVLLDRTVISGLSLPDSYTRYKVVAKALKTHTDMKSNGTWKTLGLPKIQDLQIIEYVVGHTLWYSHWDKLFPSAAAYPNMVAWLENRSTLSDNDVWGLEEAPGMYIPTTFEKKHLKTWLDNQGTLMPKKSKKDKGKQKDEGKGKQKEGSSSKKDKHRKSGGSKR